MPLLKICKKSKERRYGAIFFKMTTQVRVVRRGASLRLSKLLSACSMARKLAGRKSTIVSFKKADKQYACSFHMS